MTYYVLFFLHLESRRVTLGGITPHPTEAWITQMARNAVDETSGGLRGFRYLLHDRDTKFCAAFDEVLAAEGIHCLRLHASLEFAPEPYHGPRTHLGLDKQCLHARQISSAGKIVKIPHLGGPHHRYERTAA